MNIAIIGYGKMGRMVAAIAQSRGHRIVSTIDVDNPEEFDSAAFATADVAIEFTTPSTAYDNVCRCWARGVKVVCGTTGWTAQHEADIARACGAGQTLFWASNFSVGVAIVTAVNRYLAKIMDSFSQYEVSLTETHHIHKQDHPSGTAITLANGIVESLSRKDGWQTGQVTLPTGETICSGAVAPAKVAIHSIREGEVPGIHAITYDSPEDSITLIHDAHSRAGFALGAVLAAEYTLTHEGRLTIDDMFHF